MGLQLVEEHAGVRSSSPANIHTHTHTRTSRSIATFSFDDVFPVSAGRAECQRAFKGVTEAALSGMCGTVMIVGDDRSGRTLLEGGASTDYAGAVASIGHDLLEVRYSESRSYEPVVTICA